MKDNNLSIEKQKSIFDDETILNIHKSEIYSRNAVLAKGNLVSMNFNELHPFVTRFIDTIGSEIESPDEFLAIDFIVTAGSIIGSRVCYEAGVRTLYPNFWFCKLGPSTIVKKTSSGNACRKIIAPIHAKLIKKHEYDLERYTNYLDRQKSAKGSSGRVKAIEEPKEQFVFLPADITIEKMLDDLANCNSGIVFIDEIGAYLRRMEKKYSGDSKSTLTELYDTPSLFQRSRVSGGTRNIRFPCISLCAASTPDWLSTNVTSADIASGFLARFLYCYIPKRTKPLIPRPKPISEKTLKEFTDVFFKLRDLADPFVPISLKLSDEAGTLYDDFYLAESQLMESNHFPDKARPFVGRIINDYCLKFCIVFASFDMVINAAKPIIIAENMERAIALSKYFIGNIQQIVVNKIDLGETKHESIIVDAIKAQGGNITRTDLMLKTKIKKKDLDEAVATLKQQGILVDNHYKKGNYVTHFYSLKEVAHFPYFPTLSEQPESV